MLGGSIAELQGQSDDVFFMSAMTGLAAAMVIDRFFCRTLLARQIAFSILGLVAGIPVHWAAGNPRDASVIVTMLLFWGLAMWHAHQPRDYA